MLIIWAKLSESPCCAVQRATGKENAVGSKADAAHLSLRAESLGLGFRVSGYHCHYYYCCNCYSYSYLVYDH